MAYTQPSARSSSPSVAKPALSLLAAILFGSIVLVPLANAKGEEVVRAPSGISYVTGGVGMEGADRLKAMEKDFNLKLVFADKTGSYLSAVKVAIVDATGHAVLETTTEGPFLMARLVAGAYQINATFAGQMERQKVTVGANKLSTIDFRWPAH